MAKKATSATTPFTAKAPTLAKPRTMPGIRLLPITIFVAVLMLSVRVTDIWRSLTSVDLSALSLNETQAQQPPPPGGAQEGAAVSDRLHRCRGNRRFNSGAKPGRAKPVLLGGSAHAVGSGLGGRTADLYPKRNRRFTKIVGAPGIIGCPAA